MDYLYLALFHFFRFFVRYLPSFLLEPMLNFIAFLFYIFDKKHRRIIRVNLDLAYEDKMSEKEKERITKECYKNLVHYMADFIKNQGISKEELAKKVTFKNEHILKDAMKKYKHIILITAHYGNWELIPLSLAAFFAPLTGVGRVLDTKALNKILQKNREQFDIKMLDKEGAMKGMIKTLKSGRLLGLLVDQNTADKEGVLIEFFGKKARQTHSTALLARKMDAPIIPAFITTNDRKKFLITFYDPIYTAKTADSEKDIIDSTQKQAAAIEKAIRQKPDEWFWFHKRWKNQYEHLYR